MIEVLVLLAILAAAYFFVVRKKKKPVKTVVPAPPAPPAPPRVPAPPAPPAPPERPKVDYSRFSGETREGLEYKFKHGYAKMPAGFDWDEFAASDYMAKPAPAGGPGAPVSYFDSAYDFNAPNSPRIFHSGDMKTLAVPAGFKGKITLATGDTTGNAVDTFHLVVRDGAGNVVYDNPKEGKAYGHPSFQAVGGQTYKISATAAGPLAVSMQLRIFPG
jgi:hypothetical protein